MAEKPISGRDDISRFIVHLTRDDRHTFTNGSTAHENFLAILKAREILATRPHCLFNEKIKTLSKDVREKFNVACFTEAPLNQLHRMVGEIPGRRIALEPFGFVFTKTFIVTSGGQPAIYINSYNGNLWLREAADAVYDIAVVNGALKPKLWRVLPFLNAMHEKYDFSWEREWRVRKGLKFTSGDLVCVILPNDGFDELKEKCARHGLAAISPGWTYEQIVTELAKQQRNTKALAALAGAKAAASEKNERTATG
jgi:hypothetical protein